MSFAPRVRLPLLAAAGLAAAAALAGCSLRLPGAGSSSPSAGPPTGPRPAWSLRVPTGEGLVAMAGGTAVISDESALYGVDPRDGKQRWRLPSLAGGSVTIAGELVAHEAHGRLTMIDPADGRRLWTHRSEHVLVTRTAVFANDCAGGRCAYTRRDLRTGHVRWRVAARPSQFADTFVGVRHPMAPPTGRYVAADYDPKAGRWGARRTADGHPAGGHVPSQAWSELVAGRNLISTNHDPPQGDSRCTVRILANDVVTGRHRWTRQVFSSRQANGDCHKFLAFGSSGVSMIGSGTRIAAETAAGRPQLFDLRTGRTVWQAKAPGAPLDADAHGVLTRRTADAGPLRMLDLATGRTRWTAPDPGLPTDSPSWETAVNGDLVAVSGAEGRHARVLVYRATDGHLLGRFPGWLHGLGPGWVAIAHSAGTDFQHLSLDFLRL